MATASAFDYGASATPPFVYAGPLLDVPRWASGSGGLELLEAGRANVLVSFSTAYQDQGRTVSRCIQALEALPVKGVVTLGPALAGLKTPHADNVVVVERADHDRLVPGCALVICHGGHGTLIRPLAHGVPALVIPTGRDQPDNAARLQALGAGLRLPRTAGVLRIRGAVTRILEDEGFRRRAGALGARISAETDGGLRAAKALEALALRTSKGRAADRALQAG
jgi:UDP:flavonoid glycosyltransferase YjiC (YdhE family)